MNKPIIAILGSTSHIAKGLVNNFLERGEFSLHLYTRSPGPLRRFLASLGRSTNKNCTIHEGYSEFQEKTYDVLINCVGVGTLNKLRGNYTVYFTVTEEFDNLAIGYLCNNRPDALYISFSSGAVYGRDHSVPVDEDSMNHIRVNHIAREDYYAIARLNAEAKHRSFDKLRIVDLRLFSYFSRFIDLTDGYFITEVMNCILTKKVLITDSVNMVRDYLHPDDLFSMIKKCMDTGKINAAFDVVSTNPVEKKEILDYFSLEHGLKYEINQSLGNTSATGSKGVYCSRYNAGLQIAYMPEFSSMDTLKHQAKYILSGLEDM